MNITQFAIIRSVNSSDQTTATCTRRFSNLNTRILLAANVVSTITVPADISNNSSLIVAYFKFYPNNIPVYVLPAASPVLALPALGVQDESLSELNPDGRIVAPGQSIQLLTPTAGVYVSISYYAALGNN